MAPSAVKVPVELDTRSRGSPTGVATGDEYCCTSPSVLMVANVEPSGLKAIPPPATGNVR
jgi:hypothetical protein